MGHRSVKKGRHKLLQRFRYTDKELRGLLKSLVVLIDSREQRNDHLTSYWDSKKIPYEVAKLDFCDYSFKLPADPDFGLGRDFYFCDLVSVERKGSLEELSENLTAGRLRIESEFIRSKGRVHLLIENGSYEDIINHKYRTEYRPVSFLASLHSFSERYGFSVCFMPNSAVSGQFIYYTFYYFLRNWLLNR